MHLRDDFSASGPVSQVPASWFNKVAKFINNLIPGEGVEFDKHDDGSPTIVKAKFGVGERGTPTAVGSFPTDEIDPAHTDSGTLWEAGGANGANILMLYKSEYDAGHKIDACRLELTSDGRISKIVAVPNLGVYIGA